MSEEAMKQLWEFVVEVVALGIIVWVIVRYVRPPIRQIIAKQQDTIQKQVESAQAASVRLGSAEKKYQEAIAEARTEAAKIRDTARADAQRIVEDMRELADREVERIRQRGQDDLEAMRLQVLRELRLRVGELTVTTATELVHQHLSDDRRRVSTVDRFLDELEAMSAQESGPSAPAYATASSRSSTQSETSSPRRGSDTAGSDA